MIDTERDLERAAEDAARAAGGEFRPAYNGWPNRETWNTFLWMGNEPNTYEAVREIARSALTFNEQRGREEYPTWSDDEIAALARSYASDEIRDWWDESFAPTTASPLSDAWSYMIACVDWRRIAEALAEE